MAGRRLLPGPASQRPVWNASFSRFFSTLPTQKRVEFIVLRSGLAPVIRYKRFSIGFWQNLAISKYLGACFVILILKFCPKIVTRHILKNINRIWFLLPIFSTNMTSRRCEEREQEESKSLPWFV